MKFLPHILKRKRGEASVKSDFIERKLNREVLLWTEYSLMQAGMYICIIQFRSSLHVYLYSYWEEVSTITSVAIIIIIIIIIIDFNHFHIENIW